MAKPDWIAGAISRPGAFSAKAKAAGMSTKAYAKKKKKSGGITGKQAQLASELMNFNKGKSKGSK